MYIYYDKYFMLLGEECAKKMECVKNIQMLNDWMDLTLKRDITTNCYLGPAQYHKYINSKSLYLLNGANDCFLLCDLGSHYQMYYCLSAKTLDSQASNRGKLPADGSKLATDVIRWHTDDVRLSEDCNKLPIDGSSLTTGANPRCTECDKLPKDRPIVVDILYKDRVGPPEAIIVFLEKYGFEKYIQRLRMTVKNQDFKTNLDITDNIKSGENLRLNQRLNQDLNNATSNKCEVPNENKDYHIRLASPSDARQVLDLITHSFEQYTSCIPKYDDLIDIIGQNCVLVADTSETNGQNNMFMTDTSETNRQIAGVFHFNVEKSAAFVNHLAVSPKMRGRGIAGKLLAEGRLLCDQGQKPNWRLWVRLDNLIAQNMYLKYGFAFDGTCCISLLK